MDLTKFKFPVLSDADVAFSTLKTNPQLLEEAERLGFDKSSNPFNKLASELFFKGGALNFKKDLDPTFKEQATRYLKAFMMSFEPRHEDKEAVAALLLSNLVEIN